MQSLLLYVSFPYHMSSTNWYLDRERNVQWPKYFKRKTVSYFYEPIIQNISNQVSQYPYLYADLETLVW
jgi:hypothetical protein